MSIPQSSSQDVSQVQARIQALEALLGPRSAADELELARLRLALRMALPSPCDSSSLTALGSTRPATAQRTTTYAGFGQRIAAGVIDQSIVFLVTFTLGFVIAVFDILLSPGATAESIITVRVVSRLVGSVVGFFYFPVMESSAKQATIGKQILGLRVVDTSGARLSFGTACLRQLGKALIPLTAFIGLFMIAFTGKKQGLHDRLAGCLVVKRSPCETAFSR